MAFTLIELLVVVAIIAILAAFALPGLSAARNSANAAKCLSNLRQLGSGCQLYANDHSETYIPICIGTNSTNGNTWRLLLAPYITNSTYAEVFSCPSDPYTYEAKADNGRGLVPTSYGMNRDDGVNAYMSTTPSKRMTGVKHPGDTIFLSDLGLVSNPAAPPQQWAEANQTATSANFGYARYPSDANFIGGDSWDVFPRHNGCANVLFYDGHAGNVNVATQILPYPPGTADCLYDNH